MADYFRQRGGTGKARLAAKKQDRTTELDERDKEDAAYDAWLRTTHLSNHNNHTRTNPIPSTEREQ